MEKAGDHDGLIEQMTVADFEKFRPEILLIPLGSTEPHGPHLPYGTDTLIADGISAEATRLANLEDAKVLRLPPLPIGNNVNFKGFPFACRIRVETLMAVLGDLVAFGIEEGVHKFVIFNCHGGNSDTVAATTRQIFDRHAGEAFVATCSVGAFTGNLYGETFADRSPHAGDFETSMICHLAPKLVRSSHAKPAEVHQPAFSALSSAPVHWVKNWPSFMPESFAGRPDLSTAEKGQRFCEADSIGFAKFLVELSRAPWHPGFPYAQSREA